jgi:hypothetical protein
MANAASVEAFIEAVADDEKRVDSWKLIELMRRLTGHEPAMWGTSIVGFGSYHYRYESGREGEMTRPGFSPRKSALTFYLMPGFDGHAELLARLGKHKIGRSCLYVKRLDDIDRKVLEELLAAAVASMNEEYPAG